MEYYSTGNYYIETLGNTFRVRKCTSSCYEYQWGDTHYFRTQEEAEAFVKEKCPNLEYIWDTSVWAKGERFTRNKPVFSILEPCFDTTSYVKINGRDEIADYDVLNEA